MSKFKDGDTAYLKVEVSQVDELQDVCRLDNMAFDEPVTAHDLDLNLLTRADLIKQFNKRPEVGWVYRSIEGTFMNQATFEVIYVNKPRDEVVVREVSDNSISVISIQVICEGCERIE